MANEHRPQVLAGPLDPVALPLLFRMRWKSALRLFRHSGSILGCIKGS